MSSNKDIVTDFIRAWSTLDADKLADYFADDGCYHNIPLEPVIGRENIRNFIKTFLTTWTQTHWEILNIASAGEVVMVERLDRTKTTSGNVDLPCVGVFEMSDAKIKIWRDYFDLGTYMNAMKNDA